MNNRSDTGNTGNMDNMIDKSDANNYQDFMLKPLSVDEKKAILQLVRTCGIGIKTLLKLRKKYRTARKIVENFTDIFQNKLQLYPRAKLETELKQAKKIGARYIFFEDEEYPPLLRYIEDAPAAICTLGNLDLLKRPSLGFVGTRNANIAAKQFTKSLIREIKTQADYSFFQNLLPYFENYGEIAITSGFARGVDTASHQAAIENNLGTIAVFAGGIDKIYPPENRKLCDELLAKNGLIITEQPISTSPRPEYFPMRNRIIAGISFAVAVIQASLRSGSLITARLANEYGRDVFATPGFPLDSRSSGCNRLIKNGAIVLESVEDITNFYVGNHYADSHAYQNYNMRNIQSDNAKTMENIEKISNADSTDNPIDNLDISDAGAEDARADAELDTKADAGEDAKIKQIILSAIGGKVIEQETMFEEISEEIDVTVAKFQEILTELEITGKIKRTATGSIEHC